MNLLFQFFILEEKRQAITPSPISLRGRASQVPNFARSLWHSIQQSLRLSDSDGLHSFNFQRFFNFFSSSAFRSASLQGFFILPKVCFVFFFLFALKITVEKPLACCILGFVKPVKPICIILLSKRVKGCQILVITLKKLKSSIRSKKEGMVIVGNEWESITNGSTTNSPSSKET